MIGFVIGRFQPFHNGHFMMIREAAGNMDSLAIGVGSSNKSGTRDNPFTYLERARMIRESLTPDIKYGLHAVPDVEDDRLWSEYISDNIDFDVAFTNAENERRIFLEAGFRVENLEFYNRSECMSTVIRGRMIAGSDWEALVPEGSRTVLNEIGAVERLKRIQASD